MALKPCTSFCRSSGILVREKSSCWETDTSRTVSNKKRFCCLLSWDDTLGGHYSILWSKVSIENFVLEIPCSFSSFRSGRMRIATLILVVESILIHECLNNKEVRDCYWELELV